MTDVIVNIGTVAYRVRPLDAIASWHLSRKLAPALLAFGKGASDLAGMEAFDESKAASVFLPVPEVMARMPMEDANFVLQTCLGVCDRAVPGASGGSSYAAVLARSGGLMFQDIAVKDINQLIFAVIKANLGDFSLAPQPEDSAPGAASA